jgi:hypothetical protein
MSQYLIKNHGLKIYGGMEIKVHTLLNSAVVDINIQPHSRTALPPGSESLIPTD